MQSIKFFELEFEGRFEYHLPVSYNGFLNNSIFDKPFDLDEDDYENLSVFLYENGVSYFGTRENAILYALVLQLLQENNSAYLVYLDQKNVINQIEKDARPERCEWAFAIEFTTADTLCRNFGFQTPSQFLAAVNYSNRDLSNRYYYISAIQASTLKKYIHLYNSDVSNWFFVFCADNQQDTIKKYLTNPAQQPSLQGLLQHSNYLINIQVGGDEGYLDYVLIQTKTKLNLAPIEQKLTHFAAEYDKLLAELNPIDDDWKIEYYKQKYLALTALD